MIAPCQLLVVGGGTEGDLVHLSDAADRRLSTFGPSEERDRAVGCDRGPVVRGPEPVPGSAVILVERTLDEREAERPDVEIVETIEVTGDGADMVDPFQRH